jgi:hypothetical protein
MPTGSSQVYLTDGLGPPPHPIAAEYIWKLTNCDSNGCTIQLNILLAGLVKLNYQAGDLFPVDTNSMPLTLHTIFNQCVNYEDTMMVSTFQFFITLIQLHVHIFRYV